jgi:hypothetical protein
MNDSLFVLRLNFLLTNLLLQLLKSLNFVIAFRKFLYCVLVLLFKECLKLFLCEFSVLDFEDLYLRHVDDLCGECVAQYLIINIGRPKYI